MSIAWWAFTGAAAALLLFCLYVILTEKNDEPSQRP
jgi:hypothetical protein